MKLRVLSVAFPLAPVGPRGVGGAERILAELDAALVSAGHESVVIACEGSETSGELVTVSTTKTATLDEATQAETRNRMQAAIDTALATRDIDLVHMHGLDFYTYSIPSHVPVIVTLHLPIAWYPIHAWNFREPVQFCCVSKSQRDTCPPRIRKAIVIENGVPLPPFHPERPRDDFALVLGRICPEKNAHEALEAGARAGIAVWLAGRVYPFREHQSYFSEKIEPLFRSPIHGVQHRFLGPLSAKELQPLLASARCLVHPTLAPETSSLAAMEALAAGTPVIAYPSGALEEIVDHGVTGYLVRNVDEMTDAIRAAYRISPRACRDAAERRFNIDCMVDAYFDLYASLARPMHAEVLHA